MPEQCDVPDDEALVRRVLAGDESAAHALYLRHESRLKALAARRLLGRVRRKVGASDVVQETYLSVFQGLAGFEDRGPGSFRRWIDSVLECRTRDTLRRHLGAEKRSIGREVSRAPGLPQPVAAAPGPSPSLQFARAEEREMLSRAIALLGDDDRAVVDLVHGQGKDFAEAGRALGRTPEAARKLFARAVVRLGRHVRGGT